VTELDYFKSSASKERGPRWVFVWDHLGQRCEMASSCEDYRFQQQLLALRKRLAEDKLDPKEREELEKLAQELEKRLKM